MRSKAPTEQFIERVDACAHTVVLTEFCDEHSSMREDMVGHHVLTQLCAGRHRSGQWRYVRFSSWLGNSLLHMRNQMAHVLTLSDLDARHSQYSVCRDQVKVEIGHKKFVQILMPGEICI